MNPRHATIVAPATAPAESALAVLRLSGPLCPEIARAAFHRVAPPPARKAVLGDYHSISGEVLDQCVHVSFEAGASHTGEAVLEITCHGNPLIVRRIMDDCLARGCVPAEPGEFTRRAFLNGRMDLAQAEAVADLVHARSERSLASARRQLAGELGRRVAAWVDRLLQTQAEVEARMDFPDEDLPAEEEGRVADELAALAEELTGAASTVRHSATMREGARIVLAGAPNAGKSSLLNALLGEQRALVSPEPGTTRDYLREPTEMGPHRVLLVDTAGLRRRDAEGAPAEADGGPSALEVAGMARSREQVDGADFLLLVVDASAPPPALPPEVAALATPARSLVVLNKVDLPINAGTADFLPALPRVRLCAKTGAGVAGLKERLVAALEASGAVPDGTELVVNVRHATALREASARLEAAAGTLRAALPAELAAADIRLALDSLAAITGHIDNERMLDKLFATFCIGK
jgi:tRNA modification GTPase